MGQWAQDSDPRGNLACCLDRPSGPQCRKGHPKSLGRLGEQNIGEPPNTRGLQGLGLQAEAWLWPGAWPAVVGAEAFSTLGMWLTDVGVVIPWGVAIVGRLVGA